jgi:PAS domain S-box-containing protein
VPRERVRSFAMLDDVINNPDLNRYLTSFETGQLIMVEGDDSQDLYILVSGELEILKGSKKIWEIAERGAIFGEMSFLMGSKRTATVKAKDDVEAVCIPRKNITAFLSEFPGVSREIAKLLAERLGEASQILHGLKEFCDQLPDAVLLTDKNGNIFSWNTAAENLYGLDWHEMHNKFVEDIYVEPQAYRDFLDEVQARYSVREKILKIKHPEKGTRFVSTSTTLLYDGHHNFKGVLSLGRDVTAVQNLERRYRRARYWLLPSFILLGLLSAAIFFGYPYFSKGFETMDVKKQELRNQLAKDYVLLKSLLANHFAAGDRSKTSQLMKEFFDVQENTSIPYTGLILLDENKKVFGAYSNTETENKNMVDSSYAGIEFRGSERSIHRVLSLYRTHKDYPMGCRGIEVAFEIRKDNQFLGWLVFQMDVNLLAKAYALDEESLKKFQFRPQNP